MAMMLLAIFINSDALHFCGKFSTYHKILWRKRLNIRPFVSKKTKRTCLFCFLCSLLLSSVATFAPSAIPSNERLTNNYLITVDGNDALVQFLSIRTHFAFVKSSENVP